MPYERDPNEVGALWSKSGKRGEFLSGTITIDGVKVDIVCFKNDRKTGNAPDWRILKSVPRDGRHERPAHNANARSISEDEIPF